MARNHFITLFVLAAIWGGSFLLIRVAVPALGPVPLVIVRVALAGLTLGLYAWATRHALGLWQRPGAFLILGFLNAAAPFALIAAAQLHIGPSMVAVLNASTPLFTAIVAAVWLRDPMTLTKLAALLLGIAGVAVVVGGTPSIETTAQLLACGMVVLASFFYGIGAVYTRTVMRGVTPLAMAAGQQLGAFVVLLPAVFVIAPQPTWSAPALLAVVTLALACTAFAYILYFRLIETAGPTFANTVTLLVPVFGILWGSIFLGESVSWALVLGLALVMSSVLATSLPTGKRARLAPK
ncbi:DMT family transporter [Deinococcus peraridilitoris]|uniref:Putative permease, DMT superfamily n=1 Tax=Deinococcus peraridilitoris (strain DSM 19664 / LMG 22246 / CIP 109416 / KR-200) TaxID=937777 RepID=K9ZWH4_DEIPD|nr:DMT family transporter [Deinococcus peraridilitoris]AFZ65936.1 putative permease, DMT superfamily [Deinococcus peraridilitoris DSM 19664]